MDLNFSDGSAALLALGTFVVALVIINKGWEIIEAKIRRTKEK